MKEFIITKNEENQRLDKYLKKLLPNAGSSFLYKMMRKKNIVLNGAKVTGKEILKEKDAIKLFFADETFEKFHADQSVVEGQLKELAAFSMNGLTIVYEDTDILIANKPYNMLSQKASPSDVSANERLLGYLVRQGDITTDSYSLFHPSVANRLDRNTTGLLLMGKTLGGSQYLGAALKDRSLNKYYRAIVKGRIDKEQKLEGYLTKNSQDNKVQITKEPINEESVYVETAYKPIDLGKDITLLEVHLITGKTHQIRSHLASIGHPILGDPKYGDQSFSADLQKKYKFKHQLLHAYRVEFADGRIVTCEPDEVYNQIMENE